LQLGCVQLNKLTSSISVTEGQQLIRPKPSQITAAYDRDHNAGIAETTFVGFLGRVGAAPTTLDEWVNGLRRTVPVESKSRAPEREVEMSGILEMTKRMFSNRDTLSTTGLNNFISAYLQEHAEDIESASRATGVQASAICAAIAEEMRNVYPNENGDKRSPDEYGDNRVLGYSNASLPSLWNEYQARAVIDPTRKNLWERGVNKEAYPFANDIGPANINFGVAIKKITQYQSDQNFRSDALGLRQYAPGDYHKLAEDIISLSSATTIKLAAYILRDGARFYTSKFGPNWLNADAKRQAAALVLYFKRGEENLEMTLRSRPIDPATGWPEFFTVQDQLKQDGGPFVLDPSNWEKLNRAAAAGPVLFRDFSPPQRAAPAAAGPVLFRDLSPPQGASAAPAATGPVLFRDLSPPQGTRAAPAARGPVLFRDRSPPQGASAAPAATGPVLFRDLSPPQGTRAAPAARGPVLFRDRSPPQGTGDVPAPARPRDAPAPRRSVVFRGLSSRQGAGPRLPSRQQPFGGTPELPRRPWIVGTLLAQWPLRPQQQQQQAWEWQQRFNRDVQQANNWRRQYMTIIDEMQRQVKHTINHINAHQNHLKHHQTHINAHHSHIWHTINHINAHQNHLKHHQTHINAHYSHILHTINHINAHQNHLKHHQNHINAHQNHLKHHQNHINAHHDAMMRHPIGGSSLLAQLGFGGYGVGLGPAFGGLFGGGSISGPSSILAASGIGSVNPPGRVGGVCNVGLIGQRQVLTNACGFGFDGMIRHHRLPGHH
jgi:hypothetical protein